MVRVGMPLTWGPGPTPKTPTAPLQRMRRNVVRIALTALPFSLDYVGGGPPDSLSHWPSRHLTAFADKHARQGPSRGRPDLLRARRQLPRLLGHHLDVSPAVFGRERD